VPAIARIQSFASDLTRIRRDIHAHPELGFEERRTADLVAERLASFGIAVDRGLAGTGVVGTLTCGASPRSVGLRADLDALPLQERNGFAHRSRHEGKMHACGHDGHTTMLLGAARYLAETRNFDGTVHFIFQPAEEAMGGAERMVKEGLFARFPCESVFGMHNVPGMRAGTFAVRRGPTMAGGAVFEIAVQGVGGHGALPHAAIDPVLVASHIAVALQSIVARNVSPLDSAVISVTQIEGGHAFNVIPESARMRGTARAFQDRTMEMLERNMRRIAENVAAGFGASATLDFRAMFRPLVNDVREAQFAADVAAALVGEENVNREGLMIMASEDFPEMLRDRPGAFINIGNGEGEGSCEVHNPGYDFNDAILPVGASLWARLVEAKLPAR